MLVPREQQDTLNPLPETSQAATADMDKVQGIPYLTVSSKIAW